MQGLGALQRSGPASLGYDELPEPGIAAVRSSVRGAHLAFSGTFFQHNPVQILDDVVSVIKDSIQPWPTLEEICYLRKAGKDCHDDSFDAPTLGRILRFFCRLGLFRGRYHSITTVVETGKGGTPTMAIDALLILLIAVVIYLFYAVINPEKF